MRRGIDVRMGRRDGATMSIMRGRYVALKRILQEFMGLGMRRRRIVRLRRVRRRVMSLLRAQGAQFIEREREKAKWKGKEVLFALKGGIQAG